MRSHSVTCQLTFPNLSCGPHSLDILGWTARTQPTLPGIRGIVIPIICKFLASCPGLFPWWEEICPDPQRNARDGPWRLLLQRGYSCGWCLNHDGVPGVQFWPAHTWCSVARWFPAGFSSRSRNPQGLVLPMRHWEKFDPQGSVTVHWTARNIHPTVDHGDSTKPERWPPQESVDG